MPAVGAGAAVRQKPRSDQSSDVLVIGRGGLWMPLGGAVDQTDIKEGAGSTCGLLFYPSHLTMSLQLRVLGSFHVLVASPSFYVNGSPFLLAYVLWKSLLTRHIFTNGHPPIPQAARSSK